MEPNRTTRNRLEPVKGSEERITRPRILNSKMMMDLARALPLPVVAVVFVVSASVLFQQDFRQAVLLLKAVPAYRAKSATHIGIKLIQLHLEKGKMLPPDRNASGALTRKPLPRRGKKGSRERRKARKKQKRWSNSSTKIPPPGEQAVSSCWPAYEMWKPRLNSLPYVQTKPSIKVGAPPHLQMNPLKAAMMYLNAVTVRAPQDICMHPTDPLPMLHELKSAKTLTLNHK